MSIAAEPLNPVDGDDAAGTTPEADHEAGPGPSTSRGALAGLAGAAVALGVAEVFAGLVDGMPSVLDAVASTVIPYLPGGLVTWGIETFGTADRALIATSVAAVVAAVGALAGVLRATGRGGGGGAFAAVAVVGGAMTATDINASLPIVAAVLAVAAGAGWFVTTRLVPRTATGPGAALAPVGLSRRGFLAAASALGLGGVAAALVGRSLDGVGLSATDRVGPADVDLPVAGGAPTPPPGTSYDIDGLTSLYVPNDDFYRIDTAVAGPPVVDAATWSMRIHGLVDRELTFTLDDLLARDLVEVDVTIACVSNDVGGGLIGNARWTGVRLDELLGEAGVQPEGTQVVGRSVDDFTVGFPTEVALDGRDALVAVGMNGEPLPVEHGFPARLIVPGLYGYVSATKWLSDIELVPWDEFDAYWVPRGWSKRGPIKTQSRIDTVVPDASGAMVAGGVAWAQPRGVQRVEVRLDDGDFFEAELAEALSDVTWVQWRAPLGQVPAGRHTLTVRATDKDGVTQPEERTPEHPNGAEGWHSRQFTA